MTNYAMIVELGGTFDVCASNAEKYYAKWCKIMDEHGADRSRTNIVEWLFNDCSYAIRPEYDPGSLVQDMDGNYYIIKDYCIVSSYGRPETSHVILIRSDGTPSNPIRADVLCKADVPVQILSLVRSQIMNSLKGSCPLAAGKEA